MKSYTIIGTGAVGGYYGARLASNGRTVNFLARSDFETIRTGGLRVNSPRGDINLQDVRVFNTPEDVPPSDVLVIALKTTSNKNLKELISPLVHESTALLILQNGLGMEEEIRNWFPDNPVLGGMCFICSRKIGPGHIDHQDYGFITLGYLNNRDRDLRNDIGRDMEESDIPLTLVDDLQEARWRKLLWNIPYNGLCVVLNSHTDTIMKTPSSRAIIRTLMEEVVQGASACGVEIEKEAIEKMLVFTDKMIPYEPSMKLDFNNNRPMELDYIYVKPLQKAAQAGYEMPSVRMLYRMLRFIEESDQP
jgi:2-dehydropantoate 2-reductase